MYEQQLMTMRRALQEQNALSQAKREQTQARIAESKSKGIMARGRAREIGQSVEQSDSSNPWASFLAEALSPVMSPQQEGQPGAPVGDTPEGLPAGIPTPTSLIADGAEGSLGDMVNALIMKESGGDSNAQNPYASAGGLGQFIDSTWLHGMKTHFPEVAEKLSREEQLKLKYDPKYGRAMTERFVSGYLSQFDKLGVPKTKANVHMAHLTGSPAMVSRWLQMDPSTPAASIVPDIWVSSNPGLFDGTIGDTINKFRRIHS